ncbi:rhodanese-like domain-containing protein [Patescibacteria group bacterium]|nr:MAG: rhodanese-like domain-containing protein [Patescibacteria group bacterium]
MKTITAAQLKEIMAKDGGLTVLDVRPPARYAEKHVPGAINAPATDDFGTSLSAAALGTDAHLVLYADHEADDAHVKTLCEIATKAGYADARCLMGGFMGWMEAGGTIEGGQES